MPVGTASAFRLRQCPARAGVLCGEADADRDSGPDFEFLFSRHRRGRTGLLQAGRPGCRARTRRSRRKSAGGSQGRQPRVSRLFVTPCRRRVPRVAWREASLCPVAGHVLVSGDALGPQPRPRRPQHREGAADRRGLLGRNGAAAAFDRARHRPGTRRCPDRADSGCARRRHEFRRDGGAGTGGRPCRRLLGQRHGCGTGGAARRRHRRSGRAPRCGRAGLHHGVGGCVRRTDRTAAGGRRRGGARHRHRPQGSPAERRSGA